MFADKNIVVQRIGFMLDNHGQKSQKKTFKKINNSNKNTKITFQNLNRASKRLNCVHLQNVKAKLRNVTCQFCHRIVS